MKVPLLDLKAQHGPLREEILATMARVLDSSEFILGSEVAGLESEVAAYSGCKHGIGVSSGTDALLVALMALDIGPGDEVITTPFSFFATAGAVVRLGAKPVFVDIDPATYNLDPELLRKAITPKTKAIIPVHLYGQCADMGPILEAAAGIPVIEDAAQSIGAEYRDGRRAGSMGLMGCLSFFPSKNLGALGDGGMVVTNDAALAEKLRILRAHGSKPKYYHKLVGGNFRLDALQAAVLRVKLKHLDSWTAKRQGNAERYERLLGASALLKDAGVRAPVPVYRESGKKHFHIYNQFVLRAPRRDDLRASLQAAGVGVEVYYPVPFHLQECFKSLGYAPGDFPESEKAAQETLALPIYPELAEAQQAYVIESLSSFYSLQSAK